MNKRQLAHSKFALGLAVLALLHGASVVGMLTVAEFDFPTRHSTLVLQADGVLIVGRNFLNWPSVKFYPTMEAAMSDLARRNLKVQEPSSAGPRQATQVRVLPLNNPSVSSRAQSHKVLFESKNIKSVIYTPDALSAHMVAEYVSFDHLLSSSFGYGMPVTHRP